MFQIKIDMGPIEKMLARKELSLKSMSDKKRALAQSYADEFLEINVVPTTEEECRIFVDLRNRATKDGVYEEAKFLSRANVQGASNIS